MIASLFKPVSDTKDDGIIRFVFSIISDYCYKQKVISCYTIVKNSTRFFMFSLPSFNNLLIRLVASFYSELLKDFRATSGMKPKQIIIFRDGVSDSQFNQVLNIELEEIIKVYISNSVNFKSKY
jgi:hypothetical protein